MRRLDFAAVHQLAGVADLIEPLRHGFVQSAHVPPRGHYDLGGPSAARTLLVMPSWREGGPIGVKIATVFPDNPHRGLPSIHGEFMLVSGETGKSIGLIDGRALTLLRTAAVSALAADLLANRAAEVLLMVGTGELASYLIEGHLAVRRYQQIGIWGRDQKKSAQLADRLQKRGIPARPVPVLESGVRQADVISCATMAESPVIHGRWLKTRAHLDLVGGFRPSMREADDQCFSGALIAVDTLDALSEAGDLIGPLASGTVYREEIFTLARLLQKCAPLQEKRRTVFKSVGCALADLASAEWLMGRSLDGSIKDSELTRSIGMVSEFP